MKNWSMNILFNSIFFLWGLFLGGGAFTMLYMDSDPPSLYRVKNHSFFSQMLNYHNVSRMLGERGKKKVWRFFFALYYSWKCLVLLTPFLYLSENIHVMRIIHVIWSTGKRGYLPSKYRIFKFMIFKGEENNNP